MKMEPIVSSETSAIRTQTPGNYPKRNNLHLEHGESLRTKLNRLFNNIAKMLTSSNMTRIIISRSVKFQTNYDKKSPTDCCNSNQRLCRQGSVLLQAGERMRNEDICMDFFFLILCCVTAIKFSPALLTLTLTLTHTQEQTHIQRSPTRVLFYYFTLVSATFFGSLEPSSGRTKYKRKSA